MALSPALARRTPPGMRPSFPLTSDIRTAAATLGKANKAARATLRSVWSAVGALEECPASTAEDVERALDEFMAAVDAARDDFAADAAAVRAACRAEAARAPEEARESTTNTVPMNHSPATARKGVGGSPLASPAAARKAPPPKKMTAAEAVAARRAEMLARQAKLDELKTAAEVEDEAEAKRRERQRAAELAANPWLAVAKGSALDDGGRLPAARGGAVTATEVRPPSSGGE